MPPLLFRDQHPNFNKLIDERTGTVTQSLLCVPMRRGTKILGVVQWINKLNSDVGGPP